MLIPFCKMHAQGNDFVFIDTMNLDDTELDFPALATAMCTPHFGIGADGLVLISKSTVADIRMIIFNLDGSRAEMCGSALRCVSNLNYSKGRIIDAHYELQVETDSGIKHSVIDAEHPELVKVNLGLPHLLQKNIGVEGFTGSLIDVGNLHFVSYIDDLSSDPHLVFGSKIEHHPSFPKPVNVHFAQIKDASHIKIKIWEAACGATLACGTGATAAVFTGISFYGLHNVVDVEMPGGIVQISNTQNSFWLGGEVKKAFQGEYLWKI